MFMLPTMCIRVKRTRTWMACLSVRMIQLNRWTDLDKMWYGICAIGGCPKIIYFSFLPLVIPTWWSKQLVKWNRH
jgi:hypothetical protein